MASLTWGKFMAGTIVVAALTAGVGIWYTQERAFYEPVSGEQAQLVLTSVATGQPEPFLATNVQAIDSASSPIRFRACFETTVTPDQLAASFVPAQNPEPLTAPGWFDCYDAVALASALASGQAQAFIAEKNIHYGVDRIVAVTQDGKGYVWHALNNCGEKAYDGTVIGEECPPRPQG